MGRVHPVTTDCLKAPHLPRLVYGGDPGLVSVLSRPIPAHRRAPKLSDDRCGCFTLRIYEAAVRSLRWSARSGRCRMAGLLAIALSDAQTHGVLLRRAGRTHDVPERHRLGKWAAAARAKRSTWIHKLRMKAFERWPRPTRIPTPTPTRFTTMSTPFFGARI